MWAPMRSAGASWTSLMAWTAVIASRNSHVIRRSITTLAVLGGSSTVAPFRAAETWPASITCVATTLSSKKIDLGGHLTTGERSKLHNARLEISITSRLKLEVLASVRHGGRQRSEACRSGGDRCSERMHLFKRMFEQPAVLVCVYERTNDDAYRLAIAMKECGRCNGRTTTIFLPVRAR